MIEVKVPELAESITEVTIVRWLKEAGDQVEQGEELVEIETDKVNMEIHAEGSGQLAEILQPAGSTVRVGDVIATLQNQGEASLSSSEKKATESPVVEAQVQQPSQPTVESSVVASPAARRLAREQQIPLERVKGLDPLGRIYKEDVKAGNKLHETRENPVIEKQLPSSPPVDNNAQAPSDRPIERIRMTKRRQTIANRLVFAQHSAAMLTTFNEVDMNEILKLRKRRGEAFLKEHDVKLGFMSFFTKAVVRALKEFPYVNAEIQGDEIILKKYYDIGIAVSTEEGLVVPVVRNADRLNFAEIEEKIKELAVKARSKKLQLSDLQGGTFTITNGGTFGSLLSTPIINAPQVGILGMHTIQWRPVALDEERMENRPMMYVALSYDHRIIDGKDAVSFLVKIKELLEDPEVLLLNG
ncbi:2-oxoglutarate dehydrogenase complex dihydrolipoyllysine-residue succinyltransferase [Ammoniphilus resinae]|uniref:Dihydrolipoyllysine-residue succinyltransferase component of 2-oxoglutarate dehydrogenase complex n=1 Tax=Ammoniphilus resinae TaxID=861532 RepID=A0ABS4GU96_9BACL|nr:2-oxoglutarate dehydrogenase E2 component (dihydrolipoamide succinyltransferase) [Ammoniphilus resinae]